MQHKFFFYNCGLSGCILDDCLLTKQSHFYWLETCQDFLDDCLLTKQSHFCWLETCQDFLDDCLLTKQGHFY